MVLMINEASVALFEALMQRLLWIELPDAEMKEAGKRVVEDVNQSLYGTRHGTASFQKTKYVKK